MANNDLLYNAALTGFIQGNLDGRNPRLALLGELLALDALVNAAAAFAVRVDSKIPEDGTISDVGGAALTPADGTVQTAQVGKTDLLAAVCAAITSGRYYTSTTGADYDDLADVVAAVYGSAVSALET